MAACFREILLCSRIMSAYSSFRPKTVYSLEESGTSSRRLPSLQTSSTGLQLGCVRHSGNVVPTSERFEVIVHAVIPGIVVDRWPAVRNLLTREGLLRACCFYVLLSSMRLFLAFFRLPPTVTARRHSRQTDPGILLLFCAGVLVAVSV